MKTLISTHGIASFCCNSVFLLLDMEVSVFHTSGFRGYRFPDPASNLNVTDSIHLPAGIFKNATEGNCLRMFIAKLLSRLLSATFALAM